MSHAIETLRQKLSEIENEYHLLESHDAAGWEFSKEQHLQALEAEFERLKTYMYTYEARESFWRADARRQDRSRDDALLFSVPGASNLSGLEVERITFLVLEGKVPAVFVEDQECTLLSYNAVRKLVNNGDNYRGMLREIGVHF